MTFPKCHTCNQDLTATDRNILLDALVQTGAVREKRLKEQLTAGEAPLLKTIKNLRDQVSTLSRENKKLSVALEAKGQKGIKYASTQEQLGAFKEAASSIIADKIKKCFGDDDNLNEVEVEIDPITETLKFSVGKMYEYVEVSPALLERLAGLFFTDKIDVGDRDQTGGCESCDFGSDFRVSFTVYGVDIYPLVVRDHD